MLSKKVALGFGIAIILPMLVHYGVSTFPPEPKWKDFYQKKQDALADKVTPTGQMKNIEQEAAMQKEFDISHKRFTRVLFFAATPIGLAAIIIGSFLAIQAIGPGLMFGGIFTVIDGYYCYWSELPDAMRFLSLLATFIVLVVLGYRNYQSKA